jgi:Fe2+ or Zn2+ uptake regulation protein
MSSPCCTTLGGVQPVSRIAPAGLLLTNANRRLIAEILYDEADDAWRPVSRATVGNTLRQFDGPVC